MRSWHKIFKLTRTHNDVNSYRVKQSARLQSTALNILLLQLTYDKTYLLEKLWFIAFSTFKWQTSQGIASGVVGC